jgi:hypothetical protein
VAGEEQNLDWFRLRIGEKMDVKYRARLGPDHGDDKAVRILNRVVQWTEQGIKYEADQRHSEIIMREAKLGNDSKSVKTPGMKIQEESGEGFSESGYRSIAARSNYLSQDRPDIQFATKEICRNMASPEARHWPGVKRIARYLKGSSRLVLHFDRQSIPKKIVVWTDSDYAGCSESRKSTSGGVVMLGNHCVKSWSTTQDVIALSSGEAEYYAIVKGISQALGMKHMLHDLGIDVSIVCKTDSSAAKSIASRRGCGRVRHIEVSTLWVQEKVAQGIVDMVKIPGSENLADILTKHVDRNTLDKHLLKMNIHREEGRHKIMPLLS